MLANAGIDRLDILAYVMTSADSGWMNQPDSSVTILQRLCIGITAHVYELPDLNCTQRMQDSGLHSIRGSASCVVASGEESS